MQSRSRNDVAPTWVVTVPEHFTDDEIKKVLDTVFGLPANLVGSALVIREGVRVDTFEAYTDGGGLGPEEND